MTAIFSYHVENQLKEEFFGRAARGFFVDVGANDPQDGSQTWHLEQLGWDGVLVEPQRDLAERSRQRRRAKVYAVACSSPANAGKTMTLNLAGIQSSLNPSFFVPDMRPGGVCEVPVMTLDQILTDAKAPVPLDLVSIDVESHEIEVLSGFDLARWRPRLILIEDLALNLRLHRYLTSKGYKWVRRTGLNGWYVPNDHAFPISPFGHLQFIRKYYLGVPFRVMREALRPIRHRLKERRRERRAA
ncbi:MAG TPA: FkbM family methyltransferase [Xanthobacteraceae bacterium]